MLLESTTALSNCSPNVSDEPNPIYRWLKAIVELTACFERGPIGTMYDDSDAVQGRVHTGTIPKVIEASALLCLELAAEEKVPAAGDEKKTRLDSYFEYEKNHPALSAVFFLCLFLIGVGALTGALDTSISFVKKYIYHSDTQLVTSNAEQQPSSSSSPTQTQFTPYYFSIVTFTTLGFGDVTPLNRAAEIWITLEVILGYGMLGLLISILASKVARRS